jgi:hypothetical protein
MAATSGRRSVAFLLRATLRAALGGLLLIDLLLFGQVTLSYLRGGSRGMLSWIAHVSQRRAEVFQHSGDLLTMEGLPNDSGIATFVVACLMLVGATAACWVAQARVSKRMQSR